MPPLRARVDSAAERFVSVAERFDSPRRRYLVAMLGAAVGSIAAVVFALRLWRTDLSLPIGYQIDSLLVGTWTKSLIEQGWFGHDPMLGFPYGQLHHDYPQGHQWLSYAILRGIGGLTGDWQLTVNVFYLLTFPAVAVAAFFVLHRLGIRLSVAVVGAILYALLAFHLLRLTSHLFLAAYFVIPLAALLLIETLDAPRPARCPAPVPGPAPRLAGRWRAGVPSGLALLTDRPSPSTALGPVPGGGRRSRHERVPASARLPPLRLAALELWRGQGSRPGLAARGGRALA